jgi:sucrose-6-phosphate hydrolase SacC (GH32 family)
MKSQITMELVETRVGRATLHLFCLVRQGKWFWRLTALQRELFGCARAFTVLAAGIALIPGYLVADPLGYYGELFRPQFHFTPEKNWMNDPNGLVYYRGEYNLFYQYNPFGIQWGHMSWGHAISRDLVHWKPLPLALPEADGIMCFSGSAVVDWQNTSGFGRNGRPPLVAIYTGMRVVDGRQFQCVAYSNDGGLTWTKYAGNPVIDIGSDNFRDPKVQWYASAKYWLMVVALSAEHKVRFYRSPDLKHWVLLSEFGPANATGGVWECPDFFQLPVDGKPQDRKWVLMVNVGSGAPAGQSGTQYFIGRFDGTRFTADPDCLFKPVQGIVPTGQVVADFEETNYAWLPGGTWTATGTCFGSGPARGVLPGQNLVDGFIGRGLVNSFLNGDASTGTLTSPLFCITHSYLDFLIGGGSHAGRTCMNLLVGGKVVRSATGEDNEHLSWVSWNVSQFRGQSAQLQIVDEDTGGWGHINVDNILLADAPAQSSFQPALWLDYGPDLYATATWNDLPKSDGRRILMGWINHWPESIPGATWRGAMSIPCELRLHQTPDGVRLVEKPVRELQSLRSKHFQFQGGNVSAANAWITKNQIHGDHLELTVEFAHQSAGVEGLNVLKGPGEETKLGVDWNRQTVFVDRTHSGSIRSAPGFPSVFEAPLSTGNGPVKLQIFVDACVLEVFVNSGEQVFTILVFPSPNSRGLEFFGSNSGAIHAFNAWKLKSIWK